MADKHYLSIGEVLGLLLDEFPDVTISKIRFLESQGLIEPERTASGYRKFDRTEVDRLRFILREQRENYLPLKVIRTKLDTDTSDGLIRPYDDTAPRGEMKPVAKGGHPAARQNLKQAPPAPKRKTKAVDNTSSISRPELLDDLSADDAVVKSLIDNGLIAPKVVGGVEMFTQLDKQVVRISSRFIELGIDVRQLKNLKHSARREFELFEDKVSPFLKQRNPASREEAFVTMKQLQALGEQLRSTFIAIATRSHTEGRS